MARRLVRLAERLRIAPYLRSARVGARQAPRALSRHTGAGAHRCDVVGRNLNAWCRIPGNPFAEGLVLQPNHPSAEAVSLVFGPIDVGPEIDTLTCLFTSPAAPEHEDRLAVDVRVLDGSHRALAHDRTSLSSGQEEPLTVAFQRRRDGRVSLGLDVSFEHFAGGPTPGTVGLRYAVAYRGNHLVDLFNAAGSDKGTQVYWGEEGVPHCYALDYFELFSPFREEAFNLLEIGLDTAGQRGGHPRDAPSLRAWREFFPNALLYGYDIDDFAFFEQEATHTFRGDQASREDLTRFLEAHGRPRFRVVIDDGSHASSHQQISLAALFGQVEPAGLYVIEDLNWQPFEESPTTLEVFRGFTERGRIESPFIRERDARHLEASIAGVEIRRPNDSELLVITKKAA